MKKRLLILLLLLPSLLMAQDFAAYARKVAKDWNIVGSALAVIKDDKMVMAEGFGEKLKGSGRVVDANTVFQIGSVTKSFTATLMAMMVEDSLVRWEDPVKMYLLEFEMFDPWLTDNLQVRDLFLHRTGLPSQGGTYIPCLGYDRDDVFGMIKYMPLAASPRTTYAYNNIIFLVAQRIIESVTGKSWEENLQERIFDPLGMTRTFVNESGFTSAAEGNTPHETVYRDGAIRTNPMEGEEQALHWLTAIGPAGSISSTVTDMIQWSRFHLSNGTLDGKTLLQPSSMEYLHKGQLITSQNHSKTTVYAPCWFVEQNNHYRVYFHTGTTWGFTALCAFVPELNLGMIWLSNCEPPSNPRYAIMRHIIDHYMNLPYTDYSEEYLKKYLEEKKNEAAKEAAAKASEVKETSAPYGQYVGKYRHECLGEAFITLEGGDLYITLGPESWPYRKHKLTHINAHCFGFRSGGAGFKLKFLMEGDVITFDLDLGENENMGLWRASK